MNAAHHVTSALLSVALIAASASGATAHTAPCAPGNLTGKLLIQAQPGRDASGVVSETGRRLRVRRLALRRIRGLDVHVVAGIPSRQLQALCAALASDARVRFAELDRVVPPPGNLSEAAPRDDEQPWIARVGAAAAWEVTGGDADTPIAVLDSGVDDGHPDLAGRVLRGRNVVDDDDDTSDVAGHGTHVAGVIAAVTRANPILPVRVTDRSGNATYATITEGLAWAADHGARVANVSFGVFGAQSIETAAQYFVQRGGLVFAAGGNDGLGRPDADNPWVVSVAATDDEDRLATFSSHGPYVDLAAPGVAILSAARGGGYARVSGTSIASPIAAGAAALVMAANPSLEPLRVEDVLKANSADLGTPGYDPYFGWGRVDAARAVQAAALIHASEHWTAPFAVISSPSAGETVRGTVGVAIQAGDDGGVAEVELRVDGTFVATSRQEPHTFAWDSRGWSNGAHRLTVHVIDRAGNWSDSNAVEVDVANARDSRPPRLRLRASRRRGRQVRGRLALRAWAAGENPVERIALYVDGSPVTVKSGTSLRTLRFLWDTRAVENGVHQLSVTGVDAAGNSAASVPIEVTVGN
jgi:subtilisin family serine protease